MKWRVGPVARNWLVLVALFSVAFGGVLFYVSSARRAMRATPTSSGAQAPAPKSKLAPANAATWPTARPEVDEAEHEHVLRAATPADIAPEDAVTLASTDARRSAIDDSAPANEPATPNDSGTHLETLAAAETIRALAQTLAADADTPNRVRAITELSDLAARGFEIPIVRETLRLASADDDADIAERAKDAYDDLIQRLD